MVRQEKKGADMGPILVFMSCHSPSSFTVEALITHSGWWTLGAMGYEGLWGIRDVNE
jgi:hypothetical protein